MNLNHKIILVVGGATGIGRAAAEVCAARGASIIVADVNEKEGAEVAARAGGWFAPVDVTDEASVKRLFSQVGERHGKLDVLIQAAGVLKGAYIPVEEFPLSIFETVVGVNLVGSFLCSREAVPWMKRAGRGVILLVSSVAATGVSSSVAYGSSKGGVTSLGVTLAGKLAPEHIRVNVVHPGGIKTNMKLSVIAQEAELRGQSGDKARNDAAAGTDLGEPEGVGRVLAWLASDDADYVRGFIHTR
jgi:3(or 17)beta-hydroxysteroid dehydrogenase